MEKTLAALGLLAMLSGAALLLTGPLSLTMLVAAAVALELADFSSGVFHWAVDNYGSKDTRPKALGEILQEFQGHHESPSDITLKSFAEVSYPGGRLVVPVLIALVCALSWMSPVFGTVALVYVSAVFIAQEIHKRAHQGRRSLLSAAVHRAHHLSHASHYAIITGHSNWLLDRAVLPVLEACVHKLTRRNPHYFQNRASNGARI